MEKVLLVSVSMDELKTLIKECVREAINESKDDLEGLYTPEGARDLLKISRTTENKLNREGVLVPIWVGGRKKYTREAIEGAMNEI